jgi:hypothetical protein
VGEIQPLLDIFIALRFMRLNRAQGIIIYVLEAQKVYALRVIGITERR